MSEDEIDDMYAAIYERTKCVVYEPLDVVRAVEAHYGIK
jgi:hypothetical protein